MVGLGDIILLELSKEQILEAIEKARSLHFIDNLRSRHPNIQFDCKLRGYIGETAISGWFAKFGIVTQETNFVDEENNIDVDFRVGNQVVELKTSLIPDIDKNLQAVLQKRDIKLIKRGNSPVEGLKGDVHLQIYFDQRRNAKDIWLQERKADIENCEAEELYEKFRADRYLLTTYFVAWIDKPSLVQRINSLAISERTWSFRHSQRQFWKCKLNESNKPVELIQYLRNLA